MICFEQGEHPWGSALCALPHTESRAVTRPEDNGSFMFGTLSESALWVSSFGL